MTQLCVAIFVSDIPAAKLRIEKAIESGANCVELRIDSLTTQAQVRQLLTPKPRIPVIVTCRADWEGGHSKLTPPQRLALLKDALELGADFVDFELQAIDDLDLPGELILSNHDFQNKPNDLMERVERLNRAACRVAKIVWSANTITDNLSAFQILQNKAKPTVALCMGEAGLISRVLAKKFGAFLTFCTLPDDPGTAPGQISIDAMKKLYRWDAIDSQTKVYGVVGCPVGHSKSPLLHNAAFAEKKINAVYLPMLVNPSYEAFKEFMDRFLAFRPVHLAGLSVTIPHKENALRYLTEKGFSIDPLARAIGAVNTLQVLDNQTVKGTNTDYHGILGALSDAMRVPMEKLGECSVAILGAGGAARSAVAGLHDLGSTIYLYNRTLDRGTELAKDFEGVTALPLEEIGQSKCDIYINCTSVGMHPKVEESPIGESPLGHWSAKTVVFDTIYNPRETKLLKQAKMAGAMTIGGAEMFLLQAAMQFETWTGEPAPIELWRQLLS